MSTVKTNSISHISNSGTDNISLTSNGRLGIGIAAPSRDMVHIHNSTANASSYIQFTNANTAGIGINDGTLIGISQNNSNTDGTGSGFTILQKENAEITLGTNNSEKLRITSAGNVGIGTTSPSKLVEIYKNGLASVKIKGDAAGGLGAELILQNADTAANGYTEIQFQDAGTNVFSKIRGFNLTDGSNNGYLEFFTASATSGLTSRLKIADDGNIGIGTNSPSSFSASDLVISKSANAGITISVGNAGTTNTASIFFAEGSGGTGDKERGAIKYKHGDDYLAIHTNYNERLRITSAGKIGIGVASPSTTLHLDSTGATTTIQIDSDTESSIDFNDHGGSAKRYKIGTNISDNSGQFEIKDMTANAERLRIDSNGMSKFTRGSGGTVGHFYANARESNILIQNDARTWKIVNYDYGNNGSDNLGFHDGTADRMIIQNDGSVKIGDGDLIIGTAGHGIDFSATSDGSGTDTSELLADYEEGTWTPQIRCSSGTGVAGSGNAGYYRKIGKMVFAHGTCQWTSISGTTSGYVQLIGLPYTIKNAPNYRFSGGIQGGQVTGVHHGDAYWFIYYGADANNNFVYITAVDLTDESGANYTHTPTVNSTGTLYSISFNYQTD